MEIKTRRKSLSKTVWANSCNFKALLIHRFRKFFWYGGNTKQDGSFWLWLQRNGVSGVWLIPNSWRVLVLDNESSEFEWSNKFQYQMKVVSAVTFLSLDYMQGQPARLCGLEAPAYSDGKSVLTPTCDVGIISSLDDFLFIVRDIALIGQYWFIIEMLFFLRLRLILMNLASSNLNQVKPILDSLPRKLVFQRNPMILLVKIKEAAC